jgi:hypothetical protein
MSHIETNISAPHRYVASIVLKYCTKHPQRAGGSKMAKKKESEKTSPNSEGTKQDKNENNDEEPNFSDPEGFVDDISDEGNLFCF